MTQPSRPNLKEWPNQKGYGVSRPSSLAPPTSSAAPRPGGAILREGLEVFADLHQRQHIVNNNAALGLNLERPSTVPSQRGPLDVPFQQRLALGGVLDEQGSPSLFSHTPRPSQREPDADKTPRATPVSHLERFRNTQLPAPSPLRLNFPMKYEVFSNETQSHHSPDRVIQLASSPFDESPETTPKPRATKPLPIVSRPAVATSPSTPLKRSLLWVEDDERHTEASQNIREHPLLPSVARDRRQLPRIATATRSRPASPSDCFRRSNLKRPSQPQDFPVHVEVDSPQDGAPPFPFVNAGGEGNASKKSGTQDVCLSPGVATQGRLALHIIAVTATLMAIFQNLANYKSFLTQRENDAQALVNLLQTLLDYPKLEIVAKTNMIIALLRLSSRSDRYPECFQLTGVQKLGQHPHFGTHTADIWKGRFRDHIVCLKVIRTFDEANVEKLLKAFSREGLLWGHLSHPNLLPFYGIYRLDDSDGRIGLVSPWMENGNVQQFLKLNPDVDRLLLILDIIEGLSYLHLNNVIHRDLKGGNILIKPSKRACVCDFGLAAILAKDVLKWTSLHSTVPSGGTVRWQAPESINAKSVSTAVDIYAFGCVCYEILTGQVPFYDQSNDVYVAIEVLEGKRPRRPVGQLYVDRGLDDSMWSLMEECWNHDPVKRPNASQVLARLTWIKSRDRRPPGGWNDLEPSHFRNAMRGITEEHLPVLETLEVFETLSHVF